MVGSPDATQTRTAGAEYRLKVDQPLTAHPVEW